MTSQLFGVLAAAALTATGAGAMTETRSAQSLPVPQSLSAPQSLPAQSLAVPAQNLALVTPAPAGTLGKQHTVNRLADASDPMDEGKCSRIGGLWDSEKLKCRRAGAWYGGSVVRLLIGAGTVAGIVVAATESDHHSVSN